MGTTIHVVSGTNELGRGTKPMVPDNCKPIDRSTLHSTRCHLCNHPRFGKAS